MCLNNIVVEYIPRGGLLSQRVFAFAILIVIAKLSSQGTEPVFHQPVRKMAVGP